MQDNSYCCISTVVDNNMKDIICLGTKYQNSTEGCVALMFTLRVHVPACALRVPDGSDTSLFEET